MAMIAAFQAVYPGSNPGRCIYSIILSIIMQFSYFSVKRFLNDDFLFIFMVDEVVDLLDEHGNLMGEEILKSDAHKSGLWHTAAHVWLYTKEGKLIFQKRSDNKDLYPGRWDISAAGHVKAHEHPRHAAIRELAEELNIVIPKEDLNFLAVTRYAMAVPKTSMMNNEFAYVYLYEFDGDLDAINFDKTEVSALRYIDIDDFEDQLDDSDYTSNFVPYDAYFYMIIDAVRKKIYERK